MQVVKMCREHFDFVLPSLQLDRRRRSFVGSPVTTDFIKFRKFVFAWCFRCCIMLPWFGELKFLNMSPNIPLCLNTWPGHLCLRFHIVSNIFMSSWTIGKIPSLVFLSIYMTFLFLSRFTFQKLPVYFYRSESSHVLKACNATLQTIHVILYYSFFNSKSMPANCLFLIHEYHLPHYRSDNNFSQHAHDFKYTRTMLHTGK